MYANVLDLLLLLALVGMSTTMETKTHILKEDEFFELKCSTNLEYPVVWHFESFAQTNQIFLGGEVSLEFKEMFRLTGNQSLGEYNLHIPSADYRYVGNYRCIDDEGLGSEILSIQLIISNLSSNREERKNDEPLINSTTLKFEDTEATANSSQNVQSNGIILLGVISAFGVMAAVAVMTILLVQIKLRKNSKGESHAQKDAETHLSPDSSEQMLPSSQSKLAQSSPPVSASPEGSDCSTAPLLLVKCAEESDESKDAKVKFLSIPDLTEMLPDSRSASDSSEESVSSSTPFLSLKKECATKSGTV